LSPISLLPTSFSKEKQQHQHIHAHRHRGKKKRHESKGSNGNNSILSKSIVRHVTGGREEDAEISKMTIPREVHKKGGRVKKENA
jgi:hypothetical protein